MNRDAEFFAKLINRFCEMYLGADENMFMTNFSIFEKQVKLNTKIRSLVPEEDVSKVYAAVSFFDSMIKKQSFTDAYKISSKHYDISESVLKSVIGTRNANRRHAIKW